MSLYTPFNDLADQIRNARKIKPFAGRLLALDPGETTGWCVWDCVPDREDVMLECGQLTSYPMVQGVPNFTTLLNHYRPTHVVHEVYRVYSWRAEEHKWSDVPTLRIIGAMECVMLQHGIPYSTQTAQVAKHFMTDPLLQRLGLWQRGQRHARDSIRHATYFLCFGITRPQQ